MKNSILTIILLFAHIAVYCQNSFQPGRVILNGGDTISGQINKKSINRNPTEIVFRSSETAESVLYVPAEIHGFETGGQLFRSAIVQVNSEKPFPITSNPNIVTLTDTVFLEILVDGDKSLAGYRDKDENRNFYIGSGAAYELLKYKKYMKTTPEDRHFLTEVTLYRDQLKNFLGTAAIYTTKPAA